MPKDSLPAQLYHLDRDPGETTNLYLEEKEKVDDLLALLLEDVRRGRSTEGDAASNDVEDINLWKSGK